MYSLIVNTNGLASEKDNALLGSMRLWWGKTGESVGGVGIDGEPAVLAPLRLEKRSLEKATTHGQGLGSQRGGF